MVSIIRRFVGVFMFLISIAIWMPQASGTTLDDYKATVGREGCDSIPYDSLRSSCANSEVHKLCDDSQYPRKCRGTRGLRDDIDTQFPNAIKALESERKTLQDALAKSTDDSEKRTIEDNIRKKDEEINQKNKTLSEKQNTLKDEIAAIDKRIEYGERCSRARYDVYTVFKEVISKAESENDEDVVKIARPRTEYWKREQQKHYSARIEDVQQAIDKCKECREGKQ